MTPRIQVGVRDSPRIHRKTPVAGDVKWTAGARRSKKVPWSAVAAQSGSGGR
jgi:hypothetical protein